MKLGCCVWCHAFCKMPDDFDPKSPKRDCVCGDACSEQERRFRLFYSDTLIGERNMKQFGVNPNERGKHDDA